MVYSTMCCRLINDFIYLHETTIEAALTNLIVHTHVNPLEYSLRSKNTEQQAKQRILYGKKYDHEIHVLITSVRKTWRSTLGNCETTIDVAGMESIWCGGSPPLRKSYPHQTGSSRVCQRHGANDRSLTHIYMHVACVCLSL